MIVLFSYFAIGTILAALFVGLHSRYDAKDDLELFLAVQFAWILFLPVALIVKIYYSMKD